MDSRIQIRNEVERGCGWRKVGGLYLMGDGPSIACGRLPIALSVCPCCGHGIKPARGWTWIDADKLIAATPNDCQLPSSCDYCPVGSMIGNGLGFAELLWIGGKFYNTPRTFNAEADSLGISRRIAQVPKGFKVGETWVLLAHRKAIVKPIEFGEETEYTPGIFRIFKPDSIEVIVDGSEDKATIDGFIKRGLTPVLVERVANEQVALIQIEKTEDAA